MATDRCHVGEAAGYWERASMRWQLHQTSRCGELRRYVDLRPDCVSRGKGKLRDCVELHREALDSLSNASVLMLGDSTSAQLADHACDTLGQPTRSFVAVPKNVPNRSKYSHRLRSLDNHYCRLLGHGRGHGLPLGTFSHYGVDGPPYWAYAYPLAPWLGNTSIQQVRENLPPFRDLIRGQDPTIIVAGSGFWDIASWWANEGHFHSAFQWNATHARRYVQGVRRFVGAIRRTFPSSRLLWRTLHPGYKHSITPSGAHALNEALRAHAKDWGLRFLDVGSMMQQLPPKLPFLPTRAPVYGTLDGRHLHSWLNIELLNLILNAAGEAQSHRVVGAPADPSVAAVPTGVGRAAPRLKAEKRRSGLNASRHHG